VCTAVNILTIHRFKTTHLLIKQLTQIPNSQRLTLVTHNSITRNVLTLYYQHAIFVYTKYMSNIQVMLFKNETLQCMLKI